MSRGTMNYVEKKEARRAGSRRAVVALVLVALVLPALSACQFAKAGARCRLSKGEWALDATHILRCTKGRWTKVILTAEARRLQAADALKAGLPALAPIEVRNATVRLDGTGLHERIWSAKFPLAREPVDVCEDVLLGLVRDGFSRVGDCRAAATADQAWTVAFERDHLVGIAAAGRRTLLGTTVQLTVASCGPGAEGVRQAPVAATLPLCRRPAASPATVADPSPADLPQTLPDEGVLGAPSAVDVQYGTETGCDGPESDFRCGGSQTLDVYPATGGTPRGTLVWVHGGGFTGGDKLDRYGWEVLAAEQQRGWSVVTVNYRLVRDGRPTLAGQLDDVAAAVAHVRSHAGELGVDTSSVVLGGFSAGGTLAADAALMARGPRPAGLPDLGPGVTVDGWFALGAMLDARAGSSSAEILAAAFDDQATAAELRAASPLTYLDPSDPPGYVVHGERDGIVEVSNTALLDLVARRQGLGGRLRVDVVDRRADGRPLPLALRYHVAFAGMHLTSFSAWMDLVPASVLPPPTSSTTTTTTTATTSTTTTPSTTTPEPSTTTTEPVTTTTESTTTTTTEILPV